MGVLEERLIKIDRGPLMLERYFGHRLYRNWTIREADSRPQKVSQIRSSCIFFSSAIGPREYCISNRERCQRLSRSPDHLLADFATALAVHGEEGQMTLREWGSTGIRYVECLGSILTSPEGEERILAFMRRPDGDWQSLLDVFDDSPSREPFAMCIT